MKKVLVTGSNGFIGKNLCTVLRRREDVKLYEVDFHLDARKVACDALKAGGKFPISAGGSGTFRAVLEGCIDSQIELLNIRLGFLRKGSADLIGKVLNMPDTIEEAIAVFAKSISSDTYLLADILSASSKESQELPRHYSQVSIRDLKRAFIDSYSSAFSW